MKLVLERPAWHALANCHDVPVDVFFPARGTPTRSAYAVCAGCTVRAQCLDFAMTTPLTDGIWGGTSGKHRRALRRDGAAPRPMLICRRCETAIETGTYCADCVTAKRQYMAANRLRGAA